MSPSFREFQSFLLDFRSVSSWVAKIAIGSPFLDLLLNIGCPWPSRISVSSLAAIIQAIVLLVVFEYLTSSKIGFARTVFGVCAAAFVAFLFIYIASFSSFVKPAGSHWNREVIGFTYLEDRRLSDYIASRSDSPDPETLLSEFKRVEKIWTEWSITVARVIVLFGWLFMWGALSATIGSFVAIQRKRNSNRSSASKRAT